MITYDIDGRAYPCHMFTPLVLGEEKSCCAVNSDFCNAQEITDPDCRDCSYSNWCPTCYGFNYAFRGDVRKRDHGWCKMIDVQVRASCEFQVRYYHKRISEIGEIDASQVRAAVEVARMIKRGELKLKS